MFLTCCVWDFLNISKNSASLIQRYSNVRSTVQRDIPQLKVKRENIFFEF